MAQPEPQTYPSFHDRSSFDTEHTEVSSPLSSVDHAEVYSRLALLSEKGSFESFRSSLEHAEVDRLLEAQVPRPEEASTPPEYTVPLSKKLAYLGVYFCLNVALTLSNKQILLKIKTPWLLTVLHASATSIGCLVSLAAGKLKLSTLTRKEHCILIAFSSLFTLNIAVSNISLAMVSVPFHQVLRATCPIATVLLSCTFLGRSYGTQTYLAMIPLILGVGLGTVGDYDFTTLGFAMTLAGVLLAAIKTITTNRLMTGSLALSALELLARMSPLAAAQCLFYAAMSGELRVVQETIQSGECGHMVVFIIAVNAFMAFMLNMVSFQANKLSGALTMSICGNVKQILTIALGIVLFGVRLTMLNGLGIVIAACGAAYYSSVELRVRKAG